MVVMDVGVVNAKVEGLDWLRLQGAIERRSDFVPELSWAGPIGHDPHIHHWAVKVVLASGVAFRSRSILIILGVEWFSLGGVFTQLGNSAQLSGPGLIWLASAN